MALNVRLHLNRESGLPLLSMWICGATGSTIGHLSTMGELDLAQLKVLRDECDRVIAKMEARALDSTPIAQWPAIEVTP